MTKVKEIEEMTFEEINEIARKHFEQVSKWSDSEIEEVLALRKTAHCVVFEMIKTFKALNDIPQEQPLPVVEDFFLKGAELGFFIAKYGTVKLNNKEKQNA